MPVSDLTNARVVITGAASGIGRAAAQAFSKAGAIVFLCDVNREPLDELAAELAADGSPPAMVETVDVSDRAQMIAFADAVHAQGGAIDVLVNNAGIAAGGEIGEMELSTWDRVVGVNLMGVVHGCRLFVPAMQERGGHVINVASVLGLIAAPGMPSYVATKFAVVGLSYAMSVELHRHGIGVTAICPGAVSTAIADDATMDGESIDEEAQGRIAEAIRRGVPPAKVAKVMVRVARKGGPVVVPVTTHARVASVAQRFSPGLVSAVSRWAGRRFREG